MTPDIEQIVAGLSEIRKRKFVDFILGYLS